MAAHEPLLEVSFADWEEEAQPAKLLELENAEAVLLGDDPDALACKDPVGKNCGHAVEEVVEDPVEHLHQEREFLE